MRILHICNLSKSPYSGISVVVPQHIKNQGNMCEVLYLNLNGRELDCNAMQIDLKRLYSKDLNIDIAIFHGIYFLSYLKIGRFLIKNHIPYVVVPHCSLTKISLAQKRIKKLLANFLFFSRFLKKSSAIQFLSKNEKESSIFSSKGFVCGNGVTVGEVNKTWDDSEIYNKFVYIGRLDVFHKGLDILFDAIQLEKDFLAEKHFIIDVFGPKQMKTHEIDSTAQDVLKKMIADRHIESLVFLHDAVYGEKKVETLMDHDFFVQTSRFEGLPLGILEALSMGVPCIVTKGTNMDDVINDYDAGWGVGSSAREIADAIRKAVLTNNEQKERKSFSAVNLIKNEYSWEKIAKKEIECYRKIIERKTE